MAASAVLGGTISEIGGGKFANGAVTGAYSMMFNELMHDYQVKQQQKKLATLQDGINTVRNTAAVGSVISRKDLIDKYGVPKRAAQLIKSFKLIDSSTIEVDWDNLKTGLLEAIPHVAARFRDGKIKVPHPYGYAKLQTMSK